MEAGIVHQPMYANNQNQVLDDKLENRGMCDSSMTIDDHYGTIFP